MLPPVTDNSRRFERYNVKLPARAIDEHGEAFEATVTDISAGGAAVSLDTEVPGQFSNEAFLELQFEGHDRLKARVVREFAGGYALEFDQSPKDRERMAEEVKKFQAATWRLGALDA